VKYGALSNAKGSILIEWRAGSSDAGRRLILNWQERDGPAVAPPAHRGFGSKVIERGIAHELEGTVEMDYRPDGLVCVLDIPAPESSSRG